MARYLAERRRTQPQGRSAGSTFKNPLPRYAGQLLEAAGMKGTRRGRAQFSPMHANFMMNLGGARASEVLSLIDQARDAGPRDEWSSLRDGTGDCGGGDLRC